MKNLKKFFLSFCMILSLMAVPVYATESEDMEDYYSSLMSSMSVEEQLKLSGEQWFLQYFAAADAETTAYYKENAVGVMKEAMSAYGDYLENDTLGKFIDVKDVKVETVDTSYHVIVKAEYEKTYLNMKMECKSIGGQLTPTDITFSLEDIEPKTIWDKLGNAALNTVIGIVTVFIVLVLISFVISLFRYIPMLEEKLAEKKKKNEKSVEIQEPGHLTAEPEKEEEELVDDTELVAVITAAICASANVSSDGFVVRSIRKSKKRV